jgi:hypothetical protein
VQTEEQPGDLPMQEFDIRDLKKRIADQIELIQEMTWDGEDTTEAKETLRVLQDTLDVRGD